MFKLVIQDDEGKTTVVPLIRDEITIGRKEGNTIRLTERNVSRRHARILRNNGEVHIEDLGSYNGIRVNNARIAERVSLRVSDQVQIGDYKLYLKAEGVEQVDDARTMPIERVGDVGNTTATDVIPAIAATAAPTAPIAVPPHPQQIPATPSPVLPGAPRMVGDPNRTLVAVADTDPHGRPVASAAAVAALTAPVGYGKLVVLSSNFAGKEFELSRPQMIVGRTDENDIVVNHRSISRNHAKLVREPDTGRYTISDLQSSNGVRVNGQDYGKVELRRGDVIDLGHVRLRFVEPGEDFVFSRDAVITDVPESGNKRGLLVAIVLGVLVLGAVAVYFVTRGPDSNEPKNGSGSNPVVGETPDADRVVVNPPADATDNAVGPTDAIPAVATSDAEKEKIKECALDVSNQKWVDLETCGHALEDMKSPRGREFVQKASMESKAEQANLNLTDLIRQKETKKARAELKKIQENSVYYPEASKAFAKYEQGLIDSLTADLKAFAAQKDCAKYNTRARQDEVHGGRVVEEAKQKAGRCETAKPACTDSSCPNGTHCENDKCVKNPVVAKTCIDTGCPSGQECAKDGKCKKVIEQPANKCADPTYLADLETKATANENSGTFAAALVNWEALMACGKGNFMPRAYMAACKAHKWCQARGYFLRLNNPGLVQICLKETPQFDPRSADDAKKNGCQ